MPQSASLIKALPHVNQVFKRSSAISRKLRRVVAGPELKSAIAILPEYIREVLEPLDAKKRVFAIVRATGLSQADSFRLATAHLREVKEYAENDNALQSSGSEYEREVGVACAIAAIREWNDADWCLEGQSCREFIFTTLAEIVETASPAVARQAAMDLAKLHGLVVNKSEVKHIEETPDDMLESLVGFFNSMEASTPVITSEIIDADLL